jgi:hypothetical protein
MTGKANLAYGARQVSALLAYGSASLGDCNLMPRDSAVNTSSNVVKKIVAPVEEENEDEEKEKKKTMIRNANYITT